MILRRLDDDNSNKITAVITLDCPLGPHSTGSAPVFHPIPSHPNPAVSVNSPPFLHLHFFRSFVPSLILSYTHDQPGSEVAESRYQTPKT
jgi:hypothetical protein